MKQKYLFAFMLAIVAGLQSMKAQEAYAVYTEDNTTLTFYYDNLRSSRTGETYIVHSGDVPPFWYDDGVYANITRVVFNSSFANARPKTTKAWFYNMQKLQTITGIGYLNTSEVTTMEGMFWGCKKLTGLDLSTFNTAKVTDMKYMFSACNLLVSLNLSSFNTAKVTDMEYMFANCESLTSLDVSSFNTENVTNMKNMFVQCKKLTSLDVTGFRTYRVTDMSFMFYDCEGLTSLDVSNFNTAQVTDMTNMFGACIALTSLDLSNFNTAKVTDMHSMFGSCLGLTSLDVSNFNTMNVTDMSYMFKQCFYLESLDLSNFNTAKVTNMYYMFSSCWSLTSLDLRKFNTSNVTDMSFMFSSCSKMNTICVGSGWSTAAVTASESMFEGCTRLVGGAGTTYDANHIDASYAHIDGGTSNPGYFTDAAVPQAYACYTSGNTTLTFYYDNQRSSRTGTTYDLNTGNDYPDWYSDGTYDNVTKVVFDSSFADARPTTTYDWFRWMFDLESITGIEYLNTSEVTNMSGMFNSCRVLTELDVTHFDTQKVTSMSLMFSTCYKLTSLDLSSFNTENVQSMRHMFSDCETLTSLDVSHFNTSEVTNMSYMFSGCLALTNLNLSHFNTSKVTDMSNMFSSCRLLTSLNLSSFNTTNVTTMEYMFYDCRALTSLDLSSFNTAKVNNMKMMFYNCPSLKTIFVSENWSTTAVTTSDDMFAYSTSLVGGAGTTYDANHIDASYAHIDGGTSNPGYLTLKPYTFEQNGIWYKDVGYGCVAVTYKDENYFSYSGDVVIPESVTTDVWCYTVSTIGERAFYRCPYLKNLTIPETVDRIENEAFYDAFLDSSNSSVTCLATTPPSISPYAFDSAIESMTLYVPVGTMAAYRSHSVWGQFASIVELSYSFEVNGICYKVTGDNTVSVTYKNENYNCYSGNVVIPATVTYDGVTYTVTKVDNVAFFSCPNLTSVTMPETVTAIGNTTFKNCTSLTSITIPNSVTSIGLYAFENCTALSDVVIGSGMSSIGGYAFQGCTALEDGNITCLATTPPTISGNTFGTWHYKGASLYVPYGCYDAYASADYWKNFSDIYELEEVVNYDLWIAGIQVTSQNNGNVLGDGHVSYNPSTNTLTLTGANISSESDYGIKSQTAGLNISVQGQNTVTANSEDGIYLHATGTATIYGNGSLTVSTQDGVGIHAYQNLVLKDGVNVTVNSKSSYGVRGTKLKRTSPLPTLTLQGQETMLTAKGSSTRLTGSVAFFQALNLSDGLEILEPVGAEFLEDVGIVNSGGTVATSSKVVIGCPTPSESEAYACYTPENTTLTFYYDTERSSREGTTYVLNEEYYSPRWSYSDDGICFEVTAVVFDSSFADARPTATDFWLAMMYNLQSITGIANLNTSEVTSMTSMFQGCPLTNIDLTGFNTSKVTCMLAMFSGCTALTSLDLSSFNTQNVTDMRGMFNRCDALTSLDLLSFNTSNVTNMSQMFYRCKTLTTIYVGEGWSTEAVTDSEDMFFGCSSLVGGKGTTYFSSHSNASYAHIDGGTSNPGYFTDINAPVSYGLWIVDTPVIEENKDDVLGDGTVRFDPETNTLTLTNANITTGDKDHAIHSVIKPLNIVLEGENTVSGKIVGISTQGSDEKTLIAGSGSLHAVGGRSGISSNSELEIIGGAQVKAEGIEYYGIRTSSILNVSGNGTVVMLKGKLGPVYCRVFGLNDNLVIGSPENASFDDTKLTIVDADGNAITDEWVVIASQDYIDGIENVNANVNDSWYDLQGRKVTNPRKGIYIKKQGSAKANGKAVLIK